MSANLAPYDLMTTEQSYQLEADPDETLSGLIWRAVSVVSEAGEVGVLEITSRDRTDGLELSIESELAYAGGRRVIGRAVSRVRATGDRLSSDDLATLLEKFGGQRFTNLCVWIGQPGPESLAPTRRGELDLTVCFERPALRYWAKNQLLVDPGMDMADFGRVLSALGVAHRAGASRPVPTRQWRRPPTAAAAARAFEEALGLIQGAAEASVTIYSSRLPAHRTVRVEKALSEGSITTDCTLSLGLSGEAACGSEELDEAEALLKAGFDLQIGGAHYAVRNSYGDAARIIPSHEPRRRGRVRFTFWLKG